MAESIISDGTAIPNDNGRRNTEPEMEKKWWNKILDIEEAKHQLMFSLPMIFTNLFYYLITLVSVMLVGHLGDLQLAGATLANSWFSVTGIAVMVSNLLFLHYYNILFMYNGINQLQRDM
ncbi:putative multi antimicrobial extrusion protein [Medicago truncatula]|uniref:Putative multi antimicrobial extrusion protein n=1 Tax=Medicago truncatula TaxID=3880 RepID=A0A396JF67_MEDTR|nr:putative multi antimicrobial extrusion protein [Medicago truncatula]